MNQFKISDKGWPLMVCTQCDMEIPTGIRSMSDHMNTCSKRVVLYLNERQSHLMMGSIPPGGKKVWGGSNYPGDQANDPHIAVEVKPFSIEDLIEIQEAMEKPRPHQNRF